MSYRTAEEAAAGAARKARYEAEERERMAAARAADEKRQAALDALPVQKCADCADHQKPRGPHSHCLYCGTLLPVGEAFCDERCEDAYCGGPDED